MTYFRGVACDKCGARASYDETHAAMPKWLIEKFLREEGWTFGKRVMCPLCKPNWKRPKC